MEEAEKFMNEAFTGRPMSQLMSEWDTRPDSPIDEARELLKDINPSVPAEERRKIAEKALSITPDCMEAWMDLALSYKDTEKVEEFLKKGVEHGRKIHSELIKALKNQVWVYGGTCKLDLS